MTAKAFFLATRKETARTNYPRPNKRQESPDLEIYMNYKCWRGINPTAGSRRAVRIIRLTAKSKLPTRTPTSVVRGKETSKMTTTFIYTLIHTSRADR